jgi:hypothetical protein
MQHNAGDFFNNAVIPPPEDSRDIETLKKYTRVIIDSKDRDTSLFPDPNTYEVKLEDDIDDILSADLLSADVPLSSYLINSYFNKIMFSISSTQYTATLDNGDYDAAALAPMIESKLNGQVSTNFQVTYNSTMDSFTFASKVPFSFDFTGKNNLAPLLGFRAKVYASSNVGVGTFAHVIRADFRCNLNYNNYIILNIEQFDINKSNSTILQKTFAVLGKTYNDLSISNNPRITKYFTPPIPRLLKLKLSFYDRYGNPYDFQNMDHRIELQFVSHKQKRKYQNIFLNR